FAIPEGVIYLDGNSLGALPKSVAARTAEVVGQQWGRDLITSWNVHDWIDLPRRVGNKIAPLIGAAPGTVIAADSTSVNIFKQLALAAEKAGPGAILTEADNFPTDRYMAQGFAAMAGRELRVGDLSEIASDVAVVLVTEV